MEPLLIGDYEFGDIHKYCYFDTYSHMSEILLLLHYNEEISLVRLYAHNFFLFFTFKLLFTHFPHLPILEYSYQG